MQRRLPGEMRVSTQIGDPYPHPPVTRCTKHILFIYLFPSVYLFILYVYLLTKQHLKKTQIKGFVYPPLNKPYAIVDWLFNGTGSVRAFFLFGWIGGFFGSLVLFICFCVSMFFQFSCSIASLLIDYYYYRHLDIA